MTNKILSGLAGLAFIAATASATAPSKQADSTRTYIGHLSTYSYDVDSLGMSFSAKRCTNGDEDVKTFHVKDSSGAAYKSISDAIDHVEENKDVHIRLSPQDFGKAIIKITPNQIIKYSNNHKCGCVEPTPIPEPNETPEPTEVPASD